MKHFYEPAERVQISANVIKDEYDLQFLIPRIKLGSIMTLLNIWTHASYKWVSCYLKVIGIKIVIRIMKKVAQCYLRIIKPALVEFLLFLRQYPTDSLSIKGGYQNTVYMYKEF